MFERIQRMKRRLANSTDPNRDDMTETDQSNKVINSQEEQIQRVLGGSPIRLQTGPAPISKSGSVSPNKQRRNDNSLNSLSYRRTSAAIQPYNNSNFVDI